jgi:hypothetical protein
MMTWAELRAMWERGEKPTVEQMAEAIVAEGVPGDVRGRLVPPPTRKTRGRPKETPEERDWRLYRLRMIRMLMRRKQFWHGIEGRSLTDEKAMELVAGDLNLSTATVRNYMKALRGEEADQKYRSHSIVLTKKGVDLIERLDAQGANSIRMKDLVAQGGLEYLHAERFIDPRTLSKKKKKKRGKK